jgi:type II secretory pathway component PulF
MIYRAYALVQVVYPPVIFSYAAVVVVIAAALLYPLIDIIRSLVPA